MLPHSVHCTSSPSPSFCMPTPCCLPPPSFFLYLHSNPAFCTSGPIQFLCTQSTPFLCLPPQSPPFVPPAPSPYSVPPYFYCTSSPTPIFRMSILLPVPQSFPFLCLPPQLLLYPDLLSLYLQPLTNILFLQSPVPVLHLNPPSFYVPLPNSSFYAQILSLCTSGPLLQHVTLLGQLAIRPLPRETV